ncbi:sarcosine oxidase subunit gamma family protein [Rhizobium sp. AAP43]|uniref:sarcosine oxidase subunit gamma family protein n=1 Tax=Rhizobium sp. AAP43 TaxID=1523420 RepID=UPI0006B8D2C1|nr:sarcosine oxidase subunit gamma family protein [Rhizobium sp. AAP43]
MSETHISPDHLTSMDIERRSPLAEPIRVLGDGTRLAVQTEGALLLLLSRPGSIDEAWIRQQLGAGMAADLRPFSPGQWLLVSDGRLDHAVIAETLRERVDIVDQSHGRVRLELEGRTVQTVLAQATGLDLHAAPVALERPATTLIGHIGVHITQTGPEVFELIVMRSLAESLVGEIALLCRHPLGQA